MPRYLLSVFGRADRGEFGSYDTKEEMLQAFADTGAFNAMLEEKGHFVFADGLQPAGSARHVDGRGSQPQVTDGPYLRGEEHLGGFWVIETADMDQALALAAEGSKACRQVVEVRPFHDDESIAELQE